MQEAINAVPQNTSASNRWIIFIKAGTYRELIYVQREKHFVTLVGEDPARTVLTYNLNANMIGVDGKPIGTFRTSLPETLRFDLEVGVEGKPPVAMEFVREFYPQ